MGQVDDAYFETEKIQWGTERCGEHVDHIQNAAPQHWELPSCTGVQDTHPAEKKWKRKGSSNFGPRVRWSRSSRGTVVVNGHMTENHGTSSGEQC